VQTACSTSLVAVHLACQSLFAGQSDMAIAGGVSVDARLKAGYLHQEGMVYSRDGHCRPFDHLSQGTIRGHGMGVVVLKRYDDAVRDRDHVYAIIKGTAINNASPNAIACATVPACASGPSPVTKSFSSSGWRDENSTGCPALAHNPPIVPPMCPEPITPMRAFVLSLGCANADHDATQHPPRPHRRQQGQRGGTYQKARACALLASASKP